MARKLAPVLIVIAPLRKVVAVRKRAERTFEWKDVQAMTWELEVADDLRTQQAHDVREHREPESRKHFVSQGSAAHTRAALEHEHAPAGSRQIRRADETIVAAADDNRVVMVLRHAAGESVSSASM